MPSKYEKAICPHCNTENLVRENGRYGCNKCHGLFDVDWFTVRAVKQPDNYSCGWATTLWLLRSFGVLDVTPAQLRRELNTDARRGIRRIWKDSILREWAEKLRGKDMSGLGTLPMAIFNALSKRGLTIKNPIRLELPTAYKQYLDQTFDEGGRAILLMKFSHWVGAERHNGRIRIMDPWHGCYTTLKKVVSEYGSFITVGIVRR